LSASGSILFILLRGVSRFMGVRSRLNFLKPRNRFSMHYMGKISKWYHHPYDSMIIQKMVRVNSLRLAHVSSHGRNSSHQVYLAV
jgi:hypothetical protein